LLAKANMSRFTTPEVATRQRATEGGSYLMTSMPALRASEIVRAAARAYLARKQAEGKSRREAIRCLKRQLARVVFNTLKAEPALT